jgi:uncharacterized CHY-type Zn-finger protein
MKNTPSKPCVHCGSDQVADPTLPHDHHWSRNTIDSVICKICDKVISFDEYLAPLSKPPTTKP